ncbi:type II secretion system protein GspC [Ectothiorhodospira marina]|uniref:General secretion pathway protein C n=1 Tax=Ectothiorhodospira marina TaxID=1396821 RepID=A0A1H7K1L6_9GAMM|nr:type II secretion system protein GspC [Ectothiorhodospira marina]SEK80396.1 general secretion pathway protein C [Ectothiorhodospira marina]
MFSVSSLAGAGRFRPKPDHLARLAPWVTLGLVILLAGSLARLTWNMVVPPSAPVAAAVSASPAPPPVITGGPQGHGLEGVARLHLFGQAQRTVESPPVPTEAPETRLRLSLKGVIAFGDPRLGTALISGEGEDEKHYRVGASLPGNATLEQVFGDRVILSRQGRFEMLRLPREQVGEEAVQRTIEHSSGRDSRSTAAVDAGLAADLAVRRDNWLENPNRFMEAMRIRPVMDQGRIKGFSIAPRRDAALFRQAGLRPGDVVTAINGVAVSNIDDPQALAGQLSQAREVTLELERQGRVMTVTLPLGS